MGMWYSYGLAGALLAIMLSSSVDQTTPASPASGRYAPESAMLARLSCPSSPPPVTIPYFGQVWGRSPVWLWNFERNKEGMLSLGGPDFYGRTPAMGGA